MFKLLVVASLLTFTTVSAYWSMGYVVGYQATMQPANTFDFTALTHWAIGYVIPNADGTLAMDMGWYTEAAVPWARSLADSVTAAGSTPILFLGGAGAQSQLQAATANPTILQTFVNSLLACVTDLHMKGIDIDWEPIDPQDEQPILNLMMALKAAMPSLIITMPIYSINTNWIQDQAWVVRTLPYVDMLNVLTFEMDCDSRCGWTKTWFSSNIYGETALYPSSVHASLNWYNQTAHIPREKLGLSIAGFGEGWVGANGPLQDITSGVQKLPDIPFSIVYNDYLPYMTYHWDANAQASYLSAAGTNSTTAIGPGTWNEPKVNYMTYDDALSIAAKAQFVKQNGYGGAILWTVSQGYIPSLKRNLLLEAIKTSFGNSSAIPLPLPPQPASSSSGSAQTSHSSTGSSGAPLVGGASSTGASGSGSGSSNNGSSGKYWSMGYVVGYQATVQPISSFDFTALTHWAIGYVIPNADGTLAMDMGWYTEAAVPWARSLADSVTAAGSTPILFLGGAGAQYALKAATANPTILQTFATNLLACMTDLHMKGIDIDWEPIDPEDEQPILNLMIALKTAMPSVILSMPIYSINTNWIQDQAWVVRTLPYVDMLNVLTFEMDCDSSCGWTKTWFSSNIYGETALYPSSVHSSLNWYNQTAHIPREKLGLSIAGFGEGWVGANGPLQNIVNGVKKLPDIPFASVYNDYLPYMTYHWDATAQASYLSAAGTNSSTAIGPGTWNEPAVNYITYDDAQSIAAKAQFVKENGYGGAILWTVSQGYIPSLKRNLLLEAIKASFGSSSVVPSNPASSAGSPSAQPVSSSGSAQASSSGPAQTSHSSSSGAPLVGGASSSTGASASGSGSASSNSSGASSNGGKYWSMGYVVGYQASLQPASSFDFTALTHWAIGYVIPNADGTLAMDMGWYTEAAVPWARSLADSVTAAGSTPILFLGGAGAQYALKAATANPTILQTFATNLLACMTDLHMKGIDIDWEPIDPEDEQPILNLMIALKTAMPSVILSMPIYSINTNWIQDQAWVVRTLPYVDMLNVLTFEMDCDSSCGWTKTWYSSNIYGETALYPSSVHASLNWYNQTAQIPREKLGLAIAGFGEGWVGTNGPLQDIVRGTTQRLKDISFASVYSDYLPYMTYHWDATAQASYLSAAGTDSTTAIGPGTWNEPAVNYMTYDDAQSIAAKAQFVKQNGYGGAILWTVSQGYIASLKRNLLLEAIKANFGSSSSPVTPPASTSSSTASPPAHPASSSSGSAQASSSGSAQTSHSSSSGAPLVGGASSSTGASASGSGSAGSSGGAGLSNGGKYWSMGYIVGYQANVQPASTIDFTALTHWAIGNVIPSSDGTLNLDMGWYSQGAIPWARSLADSVTAAGGTPILFLGGADTQWALKAATANPTILQTFATNLLATMTDLHMKGIDIDWEPVDPQDEQPILDLMIALKTAMPSVIISMPIYSINTNWIQDQAWVARTLPYVDMLNVLTFEMDCDSSCGWTKTWFSSNIYGETALYPSSVHASLNWYNQTAHIPREKLGLSIAGFGEGWVGANGPLQNIGSGVKKLPDIPFASVYSDYLPYMTYHWDANAQASYLSAAGTNSSTAIGPGTWNEPAVNYITYDDAQSIAAKAQFVKENGYGGAILWTVSQGYIPSLQRNLLLEAIKASFGSTSGGGNTPCGVIAQCLAYNADCTCQTCAAGFTGASCATACSVAHCTSYSSGCICQTCSAGFAGANCADVNECATSNGGCDAHATCANNVGASPSCVCNAGYSGNGQVCSVANQCAVNNGGCDVHATCANSASGAAPSCVCNAGYSGTGASCAACSVAHCVSYSSGCTCQTCAAGFAGANCADINECATNNGGCDSHATCGNNVGIAPSCTCNAGYSGSGASCADVNECATNNGGCDSHASCMNLVANPQPLCACNTGYSGNGQICSVINQCAVNNGGCDMRATCTNSVGGAAPSCACNTGFTGSGVVCADINECATNHGGCDAHAICTNMPGSTTPVCACMPGYTGDGTVCATVDPCAVANGGCDINALCTYVASTPTPGSGTNSGNAAAPHTPAAKCVCRSGFYGDGLSCLACTRCGADQYESSACGVNDTVCVSCSRSATCPAGLGVNGLGGHLCTATSDQLCAPCPSVTFNDGSHSNCSVCTQCAVGEMVKRMCTSNSDTVCGPISVPSAESQSGSFQSNWSQSYWSIVAYVAIGVAFLLLIVLCCRRRKQQQQYDAASTGSTIDITKDPTSPTTGPIETSADDWPGLVRRRRLSVELQSPHPSPEDEALSPTGLQLPTTARPTNEHSELMSPTSSRRPGDSVQHILRNV